MGLRARNRRSQVAAVCAVAVFAAACGADSGSSPAPRPPQPSAPTPDPSDAEVECLRVDREMADLIMTAGTGAGMAAVRASAVRSPDFEQVFFIAVEFSLTGTSNTVGVWASNSLAPGGGLVLSADAFAKEFSDLPDAATTDANISPADPSIRDARDCVAGARQY